MAGVCCGGRPSVVDLAQFVEPLREEIRKDTERLAAEAGLAIEFLARHLK
jgi:hypothetical protein